MSMPKSVDGQPPPHLTSREKKALLGFTQRLHRDFPAEVREVVLFGSKARGDFGPHSDVDVWVVTARDDWRLRDAIVGHAFDLLLEDGVFISPRVVSAEHVRKLQRWHSPLLEEVRKDGVPL